jgi:hypothetical protein
MDLFIREIKDFIRYERPGIKIEKYEGIPGIYEFSSMQDSKNILFVFHALSESTEAHKKKIATYISNSDRLVIHLWEDWWKFHREKVESRLNSLLGESVRIHGRQTKIKNINNDELLNFLEKNHLNVPLKAKFKYGLFMKKELMAAMSFSKSRVINREGIPYESYELLRFCNRLNHTVVGGFSRLLNHFIQSESPDDIMTYVDKDWSDGSTYEKAGFVLDGQLPPMEFTLDLQNGERIYPGKRSPVRPIKVFNSGSLKYIKKLRQVI